MSADSKNYTKYQSAQFNMKAKKPIELDGRTGEGGGQLVRIAVALASVAGVPIRITNVRGNRPGGRGGGTASLLPVGLSYEPL